MISIEDFIRQFILPHENAYAKGHYGDPAFVVAETVDNDPGGTTKYGIDEASHPWINIIDLTEDQAMAIYAEEFNAVRWSLPMSPSALPQFPNPAGLVFFDMRVNAGPNQAWRCVQRALSLNDDGIPGLMTQSAVVKAPGLTLAMAQIDERIGFYKRLAASNPPKYMGFLAGWLARCNDLKQFKFFPDVAS